MDMGMGMYGEAALEPGAQVSAMAAIVQELLAGDRARLQDDRWLRQRATMDGLGAHAYAALEALRARLCESGATLSSGVWDILSDVRGTW